MGALNAELDGRHVKVVDETIKAMLHGGVSKKVRGLNYKAKCEAVAKMELFKMEMSTKWVWILCILGALAATPTALRWAFSETSTTVTGHSVSYDGKRLSVGLLTRRLSYPLLSGLGGGWGRGIPTQLSVDLRVEQLIIETGRIETVARFDIPSKWVKHAGRLSVRPRDLPNGAMAFSVQGCEGDGSGCSSIHFMLDGSRLVPMSGEIEVDSAESKLIAAMQSTVDYEFMERKPDGESKAKSSSLQHFGIGPRGSAPRRVATFDGESLTAAAR